MTNHVRCLALILVASTAWPAPAVHRGLAPPVLQESEFDDAWHQWQKAASGTDAAEEASQRSRLLAVKNRFAATNLDAWAMGLLRDAERRADSNDLAQAVAVANTAVELAPDLPSVRYRVAWIRFQEDPTQFNVIGSLLRSGLRQQFADPRYAASLWGNWGAIGILALVGAAAAVILVLFVRRARYYLFDFQFLLPSGVPRWQSAAIALLLLLFPIALQFGLTVFLILLFAAASLYLSVAERVVAAVLISTLALVPFAAGVLADRTSFAGTAAETLYRIDRGGLGLGADVQQLESLAADDRVGFAEHFVLGHLALRRGFVDQSIGHFSKALSIDPNDVPSRVNLGVALLAVGDLENSRAVLESVANASKNPSALFDLSVLYRRRVATYGDAVAGEIDRASGVLSEAREIDPRLPELTADDALKADLGGHGPLRTLGLPVDLMIAAAPQDGERPAVVSQLTSILLGNEGGAMAVVLAIFAALALVALGFLAPVIQVSRECHRCGRAVSRKSDPELSAVSTMCAQCVNVFARPEAVVPSQKVKKQLEISRYRHAIDRFAYFLGFIWPGLGHVYSGAPLSGVLYAFLFGCGVSALIFREGVFRAPYERVASGAEYAPVVLLVIVAVMSLRGLKRLRGLSHGT